MKDEVKKILCEYESGRYVMRMRKSKEVEKMVKVRVGEMERRLECEG